MALGRGPFPGSALPRRLAKDYAVLPAAVLPFANPCRQPVRHQATRASAGFRSRLLTIPSAFRKQRTSGRVATVKNFLKSLSSHAWYGSFQAEYEGSIPFTRSVFALSSLSRQPSPQSPARHAVDGCGRMLRRVGRTSQRPGNGVAPQEARCIEGGMPLIRRATRRGMPSSTSTRSSNRRCRTSGRCRCAPR